jgi:hypothetical protein
MTNKTPKTPSSTPKKKDKGVGTPSSGGSITRSKSFGKIGDFFTKTSETLVRRRQKVEQEQEERRSTPSTPSLWYRTLHSIKSKQSTGSEVPESGPSGRKSPEGKRGKGTPVPPPPSGVVASVTASIRNVITVIQVRVLLVLAFLWSIPRSGFSYLNTKRIRGQRKWRQASWQRRTVYLIGFLLFLVASIAAVKYAFYNEEDWDIYNPVQYYWSDY